MVTAYIENPKTVSSIPTNNLPKALQNKNKKEINEYLEKKKQKRLSLQKKIKELEKKRSTFLAQKVKKDTKQDLGSAIVNSIHNQAVNNGFIFK